MARAALVIVWGPPPPGRERQAVELFNQTLQYYRRLQESGEVESFEPIQLEPHGGGLAGMLIVRGEREKLNRLRYSQENQRLNNRALLTVSHFGLIAGYIEEDLQQQYADYVAQAAEIA